MRIRYLLSLPAVLFVFACKGNDANGKVDDALNNDLTLAAQNQAQLDSISGVERGYANSAGVAAAPARTATRTTSAPVRRTTTTRRASSSGSSSGGSGTYYPPAPAPQKVVKHGARDAAIGAVAGAVIGAATSRNKVKGAVIGGAAGAIVGAVIGNNVDKTRK